MHTQTNNNKRSHEGHSFAESIQRRLRALRVLAARPGTPGEGKAAQAAIDRILALHPEAQADPLIGLLLQLDRNCDRQHACCRTPSGAHVGVVHAGKGPHKYALRCSLCARHRGWLPARAAELLRQLFRDGRLSPLPILRDWGHRP
jgi:hypothetical protein